MNPDRWKEVDQYITDHLLKPDAALDAALADSAAAKLPPISVSPAQGKLLNLLATMIGAKRVLEIGTLGGYSTIWLARALPADGKLITLEYEPRHAEVAKKNIDRAGLSKIVDVRIGAALDTLPKLASEKPFDLVFIDADKQNNPGYFDWSLKLTHPGSLILIDNVVRQGNVVDASSTSADIVGVRKTFDAIQNEPRVDATAIQTVGAKGYDGIAIVRVR